jgi:ATP-dependent Lon protease
MAKHNIAGGRGHKARIPAELPVLPLKNIVVFPYIVAPLVISQEEHAKLVDEALVGGKIVGLFLQREPKIGQKDDVHDVGTARGSRRHQNPPSSWKPWCGTFCSSSRK